jgi:foldase protein PrsA
MPKAKKTAGKTNRPAKLSRLKKNHPLESVAGQPEATETKDLQTALPEGRKTSYRVLIFLSLIVLVFFLFKNGLITAAIVNGKPIFSWQLYGRLMSRFGAQTLESIITEDLIADASRQAGVALNQADIEARQDEMLKSVGEAVTLEDLLKYQGLTKEDFQNQLKLQLSVEKILGKEITISDAEISQYLASYSARMAATTEAELREEARKALFDQQVGQRVSGWFAELKNKARIMKFL